MTRTFYPGGWYADAAPTGEFCVLIPRSHIETHLGRVEFPAGETFGPLYLRCTNIAGFRFAGQAHDTLNPAWHEWNPITGWHSFGPPCAGESPLIYDAGGTLRHEPIVYPDGSVSSQGYRYVAHDGQLVTGDATYGPWHGLSEWSAVTGDLFVGQGHDIDAALVWDWTALRVLEPGDCRFIRCAVDGENVAIAMMKTEGAVIWRGTLAELRALPLAPIPGTQYHDGSPAVPTPSIPPLLTPPKPASKKKKFGSWLALIGGAVTATLLLTHQGHQPAPRPTPVPPVVEQPAPTPEPPPPPVVVTLSPLTVDGPIFRANGEPFRWKGVTAFGLLNQFAKGEDIGGFLSDFKGFNVLRVFCYTPVKEWGAQSWDTPSADVVLAFLKRVEQDGFYVELVLLTDDDSARIEPARQLVESLKAARQPNVLLEIGNEPETHKAINVKALRATLDGSGFLYSSGNYEDSRHWFGSWLGAHTGRDADWPRRAHDLLDYYHGGGPNFPEEPALKVPIVADEPIRPDQSGFNVADFRAYFGAVSLLGAGGTYHAESMKYGRRPTPDELRIAGVVLEALNAFPADAPKGPYRRLDEGPGSLRTYAVGPWLVRVRPTTPNAPEPGWTPIDADGILWKR